MLIHPPLHLTNLQLDRLRFFEAAQKIDRYVGSGLGEREGNGATDPPTRTRN
jgi:hypothetical protein